MIEVTVSLQQLRSSSPEAVIPLLRAAYVSGTASHTCRIWSAAGAAGKGERSRPGGSPAMRSRCLILRVGEFAMSAFSCSNKYTGDRTRESSEKQMTSSREEIYIDAENEHLDWHRPRCHPEHHPVILPHCKLGSLVLTSQCHAFHLDAGMAWPPCLRKPKSPPVRSLPLNNHVLLHPTL